MTRLLLDTHAVLFWWSGSAELSPVAREAISDERAEILVSAASCWEISTKFRIGKLAFAGDPAVKVPQLMAQHGFDMLVVRADHALRAGALAGARKDPFDRLIAAQALIDDLTVVTRDRQIADFGCKVLW